jgi:hypothetical protein
MGGGGNDGKDVEQVNLKSRREQLWALLKECITGLNKSQRRYWTAERLLASQGGLSLVQWLHNCNCVPLGPQYFVIGAITLSIIMQHFLWLCYFFKVTTSLFQFEDAGDGKKMMSLH